MAVKDTMDCWRFRALSSVLKLFTSIDSSDHYQPQNTQLDGPPAEKKPLCLRGSRSSEVEKVFGRPENLF